MLDVKHILMKLEERKKDYKKIFGKTHLAIWKWVYLSVCGWLFPYACKVKSMAIKFILL